MTNFAEKSPDAEKKVYCCNCKHMDYHKGRGHSRVDEFMCIHKEAFVKTKIGDESWYEPEKFEYEKVHPSVINANNDCPLFEAKSLIREG